MSTLALVGDVISQHGLVVLAAGDDPLGSIADLLGPTGSTSPTVNLAIWSAIVATIAPYVIAVINQPKWSAQVKATVTVLVSLGLGGMTAWLEGHLDPQRLLTSGLVILAASTAIYKKLDTIKRSASALEEKTSPSAGDSEIEAAP